MSTHVSPQCPARVSEADHGDGRVREGEWRQQGRDAYPPVDVRYPVRNCRCAINTPDTGWRCKNSIFPTEPSNGIVDVMVRYNESSPSALSTIDLWCLGGAVGDVPRDATTFWHRDKPFTLNFEAD